MNALTRQLPQRRHHLVLDIGADSVEALRYQIEQVVRELREEGNRVVTGSPSSGGHWTHEVNRDQTAAGYRAELAAYIAQSGGAA